MWLAQMQLTLHDSLFFATREMGPLYETERFIHNYALSYALFNDSVIQVPYHAQSYEPRYRDDLGKLNELGVYVTPARPVRWDYLLVTWKMAQVTYYRRPERFGGRNFPMNYGRAKELAPGSTFEFFVLATDRATIDRLPRWIRLGKWSSKAEVARTAMEDVRATATRTFTASCVLNPLDVAGRLVAFDVVAMPPVSLLNNAVVEAECFQPAFGGDAVRVPEGMRYVFS